MRRSAGSGCARQAAGNRSANRKNSRIQNTSSRYPGLKGEHQEAQRLQARQLPAAETHEDQYQRQHGGDDQLGFADTGRYLAAGKKILQAHIRFWDSSFVPDSGAGA